MFFRLATSTATGLARRRFLASTGASAVCAACSVECRDTGREERREPQDPALRPVRSECGVGYDYPPPEPRSSESGDPDFLTFPDPKKDGSVAEAGVKVFYRLGHALDALPRPLQSLPERREAIVIPGHEALTETYPSMATPRHVQLVWAIIRRARNDLTGRGFILRRNVHVTLQSFAHLPFRAVADYGDFGSDNSADPGSEQKPGIIRCEVALVGDELFMVLCHEVFHIWQFQSDQRKSQSVRFQASSGATVAGWESSFVLPLASLREGAARLVEDYLRPAAGKLAQDARVWFSEPGHPLMQPAVQWPAFTRATYQSALFWSYLAEQHGRDRGGLDAIRLLFEKTSKVSSDQMINGLRDARGAMAQPGDFDRIHYLDPQTKRLILSDETSWGNFLVALAVNGSGGRDSRFVLRRANAWRGMPGERLQVPPYRTLALAGLPISNPDRLQRLPVGGGSSKQEPLASGIQHRFEPSEMSEIFIDKLSQPLLSTPQAEPVASCRVTSGGGSAAASEQLRTEPTFPRNLQWLNPPMREARFTPDPYIDDRARMFLRSGCVDVQNFASPELHVLQPYAMHAWRVIGPADSSGNMVRVRVIANEGLVDALVQIIILDNSGTIKDLIRQEALPGGSPFDPPISTISGMSKTERRTALVDRTVSLLGAAEILILVSSREWSGGYTLGLSRVENRALLLVTPWNAVQGTSYTADPALRSWTWRSPDLWVDPASWTLNLRIRNLGDDDAKDVTARLFYHCVGEPYAESGWHEMNFGAWWGQGITDKAITYDAINRDGSLAKFLVRSAASCRRGRAYRTLNSNTWAGLSHCADLPDANSRHLILPWPLRNRDREPLDPRHFLIMATLTASNNAEPGGTTVVASPGGTVPRSAVPIGLRLS